MSRTQQALVSTLWCSNKGQLQLHLTRSGALQAYIWEDKVFRSDFMGARLQRHIISPTELDAKIAGAPPCLACDFAVHCCLMRSMDCLMVANSVGSTAAVLPL